MYKETLISARTGFDVTDKEMEQIDKIASPLIKNGLSPYHVKQTLGDELPVSESTLRRMIDRCELNARNVDLRVKVKLNPRDTTKNKARNKELSVSKIGHFYADYLRYIEENDTFTVEMDCVEGKKGETDALLTLTWTNLSLQIAIILEEQTSECVVEALDKLEEILGEKLFIKVFPLILTDNGTEFNGYFYSFDYHNVHFLIVNSQMYELEDLVPNLFEIQENWLKNDKTDLPWKVVLMHKDIYDYMQDKIDYVGEKFMPLFNEIGVDLVLTGHLHTYRRRKRFKKNKPLYILCGLSGDQRYTEPERTIDEVSVTPQDNYMILESSAQMLRIRCYDVDGTMIDDTTLIK